jgi:hypothetical protein
MGSGRRLDPIPYRLFVALALLASLLVPTSVVEHGPVMCPFRLMTGIPCPSCGLTRSWVFFMHGDLAQSLHYHVFGWATLFVAVLFVLGIHKLIPDIARQLTTKRALSTIAAFWISFWVLERLATVVKL